MHMHTHACMHMQVASLRRSGASVDLQKILLLKGLKEDKLADAFSMASASAADMKKIAAEKMAYLHRR